MKISTSLNAFIEEQNQALRARNLWRNLTAEGPVPSDVLDLRLNDYLGLSRHPELVEAFKGFTDLYGLGGRASRLSGGSALPHQEAEAALARFKGTEDAVLFSSGYLLNSTVLSVFPASSVLILADKLSHASLLSGLRGRGQHGAPLRFCHNDPAHLDSLLEKHRKNYRAALIISEGLFSMEGDTPPLEDILEISRRHACDLYLDEAHSTGVLGPQGRGLGYQKAFAFHMGTLSKALGLQGAYIASSRTVCDFIRQKAGGFVFSTALMPAVAACVKLSLTLCLAMDSARNRLDQYQHRLRRFLTQRGFSVPDGSGPILPIVLGDETVALKAGAFLQDRGILAGVIRPPTVPPKTARLRLSLSSSLEQKDITRLEEALAALAQEPFIRQDLQDAPRP